MKTPSQEGRSIDLPRENPDPKGGMVRRLLLLAALVVVATLAFSSVAMAQYVTPGSASNRCSGAAENLEAETGDQYPVSYFTFVPNVGGCVITEGSPSSLLAALNYNAVDPDTGERIGIVKDLDPDLSSGANSVTYQEFCGDFDETPLSTAQEYFEQDANAKEQAILDPNGDGLACTSEDEAFLAGDTGGGGIGAAPDGGAGGIAGGGAGGIAGGGAGGMTEPTTPAAPTTPTAPSGGSMTDLPDTGGPALLLPAAGLALAGLGALGFGVSRRRR